MFPRRAWRWLRHTRRPRWLLVLAVAGVGIGLVACAPAPVGTATGTASGAASTATPTPAAGAPAAPPSELSVPGILVAQSISNDPALPVSVRRPIAPGQEPLTTAIAQWAEAGERAFRADYRPDPQASPELNVTWQVVMASGPVLGIRMETYEFGGASGRMSQRVFYGDGRSSWTGADLIEPSSLARAAAAVRAAMSGRGIPTIDPPAADAGADTALFTDLTLAVNGDLRLVVDEGVAAPNSSGVLEVTIPAASAAPLLSERGRAVADAVRRGLPYAVSVPTAAAPTAPAPAADPAPPPAVPPAAPAPGRVDCAIARCVALTFDDGPGAFTGTLLDHLAAGGARATFFVLGQNARVRPELVTRMVGMGMTVANHTWDHRDMRRLGEADARSQVDRTATELTRLGVPPSILLRPPYGSYGPGTRTLGQALILWDVDTEDWRNRDSGVTTSRALATVRPGSIILMHDIHASTVAAVPGIIAAMRDRGYTLVTVPELLGPVTAGQVYTRRA